MTEHLFCAGFGYVAGYLAGDLLARGWRVSGTSRAPADKSVDPRVGLLAFDGSQSLAAGAMDDVTHVVHSIAPGEKGDGFLVQHRDLIRRAPNLRWFGYLSTTGVYGDRAGGEVSEADSPRPGSARARRRVAAETAWRALFAGSPVTYQVFRLGGIYGPGRNVLEQLRAGRARIIDKPGQVFSRIHVADIVAVLTAAIAAPKDGAIYNVADDLPSPSGDVIRYGAELLGCAPPPVIPFGEAELSPMARAFYSECRRVRADRAKAELGWRPRFPTYREGLRALHDLG